MPNTYFSSESDSVTRFSHSFVLLERRKNRWKNVLYSISNVILSHDKKKKLYFPFIFRAVTFSIAIVTNLHFNNRGWENNYATEEVKNSKLY